MDLETTLSGSARHASGAALSGAYLLAITESRGGGGSSSSDDVGDCEYAHGVEDKQKSFPLRGCASATVSAEVQIASFEVCSSNSSACYMLLQYDDR